ncbi:MAG: hypothetical protein EOM69_08995 [Clostridia bacterium]|nr:hypothetical protein [Clostridia bacterium]
MLTKERLENYRGIRNGVTRLEDRLRAKHAQMERARVRYGDRLHIDRANEEKRAEAADVARELERALRRQRQEAAQIEREVARVRDCRVREIIRMRYLEDRPRSWVEIGREMGYSERQAQRILHEWERKNAAKSRKTAG